jgi:hypothetical protein
LEARRDVGVTRTISPLRSGDHRLADATSPYLLQHPEGDDWTYEL